MHDRGGPADPGPCDRGGARAGVERIVVVTAPDAEVRAYAARRARNPSSRKQLGTGHAAACARVAAGDFAGVLVVTYGDMPLVTAETFERHFAAREKAGMAIVAFRSPSHAYGRVIVDRDGMLDRIVEFKDANDERARARSVQCRHHGGGCEELLPLGGAAQERERAARILSDRCADIRESRSRRPAPWSKRRSDMMGVNSRAELAPPSARCRSACAPARSMRASA
jgi:bifunctional UDP-N-acetylglucosamine pyrophosphorylase/glucosamine-1-phosphate N-acetyltransferase